MSTLVKICGLTLIDDVMDAIDCGADFLGFNFYPDSKRYIEPEEAKKILEEIPNSIPKVGIFVNDNIERIIDIAVELGLDFLQFHGDETPEFCNQFGRPWFKAFRLESEADLLPIPQYHSEWLLVDAKVEKAFGGTGVVGNWDLSKKAKKYGDLFLSGGLTPENVEMAICSVEPYAVDVASGVESSPGVKDHFKMEQFIAKAKTVRRFKTV